MFENFEEPWKGRAKFVDIRIKDIATGKNLTYGPGTFVDDSLSFTEDLIGFKLEVRSTKYLKYRRTIGFPLKYIKFFEIGEFYDPKDQSAPRSYVMTFYVEVCSAHKIVSDYAF